MLVCLNQTLLISKLYILHWETPGSKCEPSGGFSLISTPLKFKVCLFRLVDGSLNELIPLERLASGKGLDDLP